jgi:hypothetical protein
MNRSNQLGIRSLLHARQYGATSRVIDIPTLIQRYHASYGDPAARIFSNSMLNRSIIIKHTIRAHEAPYFDRAPRSTVKIVFPFSDSDLSKGGASLMFGEKSFEGRLFNYIGSSFSNELIKRDIDFISLLNSIPSFDPFLISERATIDGIFLPKGIVDVSAFDLLQLKRSTSESLSQITSLIMQGDASVAATHRFAAAFLGGGDDERLSPLRSALRMGQAEFREAVYAWKGILFYRWKMRSAQDAFDDIVDMIKKIKPTLVDPNTEYTIRQRCRHVIKSVNVSLNQVNISINNYNSTIDRFIESKDPSKLVNFLKKANTLFSNLGEHSGTLSHAHEYMKFASKSSDFCSMKIDHTINMLNGLTDCLPEYEEI